MSGALQPTSDGEMMQLEEITPPDPRLAGWNDDDAPVAMRCLACVVEPKQASSLIRELHDALPASSGGVAHVKRVKKGDDGSLRVVLAAENLYDDVSRADAYRALLQRRSELARESLDPTRLTAKSSGGAGIRRETGSRNRSETGSWNTEGNRERGHGPWAMGQELSASP